MRNSFYTEVSAQCHVPFWICRDKMDLIPTYWNRVTLKRYTYTVTVWSKCNEISWVTWEERKEGGSKLACWKVFPGRESLSVGPEGGRSLAKSTNWNYVTRLTRLEPFEVVGWEWQEMTNKSAGARTFRPVSEMTRIVDFIPSSVGSHRRICKKRAGRFVSYILLYYVNSNSKH